MSVSSRAFNSEKWFNAHLFDHAEDWRSASFRTALWRLDPQPIDRPGTGAERDDARVLRAARVRRPHPHRGDFGFADGRRLSAYARRLVGRAGRGLAQRRPMACTRPAAGFFSSSGTSGASPIRCSSTASCRSRRARIAPKGHVSLVRPQRPYVTPRALETEEIPGVIEAFRQGAENAKAAGFDGVEVHGANGYLLDQFLQDGTNKRDDTYGGPIENRARLLLEVTDAVVSVWGAGRVGVHLAPRGDAHDMGDSDLPATFGYVARANSAGAASPSSRSRESSARPHSARS